MLSLFNYRASFSNGGLLFLSFWLFLQTIEANWRCGRHNLQRIQCRSENSKGVYCLQYDDDKIISGLRDNSIKVCIHRGRSEIHRIMTSPMLLFSLPRHTLDLLLNFLFHNYYSHFRPMWNHPCERGLSGQYINMQRSESSWKHIIAWNSSWQHPLYTTEQQAGFSTRIPISQLSSGAARWCRG